MHFSVFDKHNKNALNSFINVKNKKIFIRWINSYALVILVVLGITVMSNMITSSITKKETNRVNSKTVAQAQAMLDNYLHELEKLAYNTLNVSMVQSIYANTDFKMNYQDNVQNLIQHLNALRNSNKLINEVFLVFNEQDICITTSTVFNKQILYDSYFRDSYDSKEQLLNDFYNINIKSLKFIETENGGKKLYFVYTFTSLRSYLSDKQKQKPVIAIIAVDPDLVLNDLYPEDGGNISLLEEDGTVIYSQRGQKMTYVPIKNKGSTTVKQDGLNYTLNYLKSSTYPIWYIHTINTSLYLQTIDLVNTILMACYLLCIIIALLIAYFLAKRNLRPINVLLEKIELNEKMERVNENKLKESWLAQFILGNKIMSESELWSNDLRFHVKYFVVGIFNVLESALDDDEMNYATYFSIKNVFMNC